MSANLQLTVDGSEQKQGRQGWISPLHCFLFLSCPSLFRKALRLLQFSHFRQVWENLLVKKSEAAQQKGTPFRELLQTVDKAT